MTKKVFAKTIKLFLLDGIPNGRMTCELSNWTGKAYKLPRNIIKRLSQHLNEKDYWNEAVVLISKDDNLNKAHIKYLENRLHQIAVKVNRYEVKNSNTPTQPSISESDQAEMEEFIENIKMLVNVLGFKAFEELVQKQDNDKKTSSNFFIKAARGANAQGQQTSDGFVVLKGSEIASSIVDSYPDSWKNSRQELIDNKIIIEENGKLVFTSNYLFNSPSAAAAIVMGRSANGLTEWKNNKGTSLKDIESVKS